MLKSLLTFILIPSLFRPIDCVMFSMRPNTQRCFKEDIQANQLLMGEYFVSDAPGQYIDYIARDTNGHILAQKQHITKGKFSFMSDVYDAYEICFKSTVSPQQRGKPQEVSLVTKKGVETKTYDGIGEASKLLPIEVDLKRLEDLSDAIVRDFISLHHREEQLRNANAKTNNRVLFFSIFSMCCLLGLAAWQVLYLHNYFKIKKLIA